MSAPSLRAALAGFDDAALATLANPGLVRRAHRDLAEGKLHLRAQSPDSAEIEVDGQRVTIDARGPAQAHCTCPAAGACRHRIGAVLLLRTLADDAAPAKPDEGNDGDEGNDAPPTDTTPESILAVLDRAALEKWAGKASWRAARELVGEAEAIAHEGHAVTVGFAAIEGPVRILAGQGPEGIVSKAAKPRVKAYHAAAVLAARRHFGLARPDETAA
ncbi:SWIM zinc finger domain-containing protein, partial [Novosphingobium sp. 1949]